MVTYYGSNRNLLIKQYCTTQAYPVACRWRICLQSRRCRRYGFGPWVGKIPWRRKWLTPVFLPGESHGQRILVGYCPWDCKSHTWLGIHTHTHTKVTLFSILLGRDYSLLEAHVRAWNENEGGSWAVDRTNHGRESYLGQNGYVCGNFEKIKLMKLLFIKLFWLFPFSPGYWRWIHMLFIDKSVFFSCGNISYRVSATFRYVKGKEWKKGQLKNSVCWHEVWVIILQHNFVAGGTEFIGCETLKFNCKRNICENGSQRRIQTKAFQWKSYIQKRQWK